MKKMLKNRILLGLLSVSVLLPSIVFAAVFRSGNDVLIGIDETIANDLYAAGGSVTESGIIEGDFFGAGGNVMVGGRVDEDAFLAGGTITITADIGDDLRIAGGTISLQGEVVGDALIGGGQVTIRGNGIGGDAVIGGGTVRVDAPIGGNVRIGGGEVFLNSQISGNVVITADKLIIGDNASIDGNLKYRSPQEATISENAAIAGAVDFEKSRAKKGARSTGIISLSVIIKFLMTLAGALIFGLFFKRYSLEVTRIISAGYLQEFGRGLIIAIVLPVISIILMVTILGIPLGILGLLSFALAILFSVIFAPVVLGSLLYNLFEREEFKVNWKTILVGAFAFSVLGIIPIIGWIAQCAAGLTTLGGVLRLKWGLAKEWR